MENNTDLPDTFCADCGENHNYYVPKCEECGGCTLKYGSQLDVNGELISNDYPIFECTNVVKGLRCGGRVFWD